MIIARKIKRIDIRVSPAERQLLERLAQSQNLKLSEYLRKAGKEPQLVIPLTDYQKQVRRSLMQLHQVKQLHHQRRWHTNTMAEVLARLEQGLQVLETSIDEMLKHDCEHDLDQ